MAKQDSYVSDYVEPEVSLEEDQAKTPPKTPPKTLSVPEAGKLYFDLSRNASYEAANRGELPVVQIGKIKRVPVKALEEMLAAASRQSR
jgi:hypothetical protein